ncbi:phosphotransferase enzyme family protein [Prauserella cavernicola]|uniref:Phosphotransferase n=1 Tax=Prauserella cavernicola TaxID=2800127 RepID=A0A934V389_9PSEU|nr:phosphotransferase [Prauserella cavernicola]MBK1783384.1 phosphotransferase [Prauserella cavernicola]
MSAERLRELLASQYDLPLRTLEPVDGGADPAALLCRATDEAGLSYAVKWTSGGSPAGVLVPAALGRPAPVRTRTGELWADVDGARLSVVEWIDGAGALESTMDRDEWVSFGALLARLHALPVDAALRAGVAEETFDPGRWVTLFDEVDAALDTARSESARRLAALWLAHRDDLRAVRERTVGLAAVLSRRDDLPAFVPCHADPHLGNVVLPGPGEAVLIDFDDAVLAPRERDLMFVLGGGVLATAPVTTGQQEWFAEGYGPCEPDPALLAYYRGVRVLEDVAEPVSFVLDPATGQRDRETCLGYVAEVVSPTGLLAQACRHSAR